MCKLYVIGGEDELESNNIPCMFYDKHSNSWNSISAMMEGRANGACTVFKRKIVVCGDIRKHRIARTYLKSIESYDYHENKWSLVPSMLKPRYNHTAVSLGNKIFIVGGCLNTCEVFDGVTRMFTSIMIKHKSIKYLNENQAICSGYKIYFFQRNTTKVRVYSFDLKHYVVRYKTSINFQNSRCFSCTKIPMF